MTKSQINNKIKQAEKELARMNKKQMAAEVIAAQENVVFDLKEQQKKCDEIEQLKSDGTLKDVKLTFAIVDDDTMTVTEKQYKVALVKHNRPINHNKVNGYISIIANDKYEKAIPILAVTATYAIQKGYEVRDIDNNKVTIENSEDYIVILDGQHRTLAFLNCSLTEQRIVPNTRIRDGVNIGQYLVDINDVGTSWSMQDRFAVAALTSNNTLAQEIANRIDEGFSPSTASLIYTGKKISGTQVKKLLRGKDWTLPEGAMPNIARGNKFIQLCLEANIVKEFVKKRFFINAFNSYALSVGEDVAFDNLSKLKNKNLTEEVLKAIKDDQGFIELLAAA